MSTPPASLPPEKQAPDDNILALPGYPFVRTNEVASFLAEHLLTNELDELSSILWLVATPDSSHIAALHEQIVRGREIIITETPRLHLLWYHKRVFIKPLPSYLLDDTVWKTHLNNSPDLKRAVDGYLRSYTYLIRCQSDFDIAIEKKLIPTNFDSDGDGLAEFFRFIGKYRDIPDADVPRRYRYGDLRLSRINFYNRFVRFELYYHKTYGRYGSYFGSFMEPFLFVFVTAGVVLSAMQVLLAVGQMSTGPDSWKAFLNASRLFSIACFVVVAAFVVFFIVALAFLLLRELVFALRKQSKKAGIKRKRTIQASVHV